MSRPTRIHIDLRALAENRRQVSAYASKSKVMSCVKANAYGHGAFDVAKVLAPISDALAVASIEEGLVLREQGIASPILLLEGFFHSDELKLIADNGFWTVVHNAEQLAGLEQVAADLAKPIDIWLKVDTGMHRLGFAASEVPSVYQRLRSLNAVGNIRFMTHFACADEPENSFTEKQIACFDEVTKSYAEEKSLANSPGIIHLPHSHADWVRPGFMLYGLSPFGQAHSSANELNPVMTFSTQVMAKKTVAAGEGIGYNHGWHAERETTIAVLAAGYGDGYPRNTKNGCPVLIEGQIAKTIGFVAMDMMIVDITGLSGIEIGSAAELWGKNLSVNQVAAHSGYSPYELLTRMPPRVHREYKISRVT